jgi:uracil-DNA glycosylase
MSATTDSAPPSDGWRLLDPRRRAMLAEMGVAVPWPQPVVRLPPLVAERGVLPRRSPDAEPARVPVVAPVVLPVASPVIESAPAGVAADRVVLPFVPATSAGAVQPGATSRLALMDWAALETAAVSCGDCSLCATRQQVAFAGAPAAAPSVQAAQWLVVGDAPGEHDDASGACFSGPAGQVLDSVLRAVSLSRSGQGMSAGRALAGVYLTHLVKCRPPGNRQPEVHEVHQCSPYLERQIELLQPRVIVVVGRLAAQALLLPTLPDVQTRPLGQLRGTVHRYRGIPVIVSYPPSYLLRNLAEKAKAWADWCLALDAFDAAGTSSGAE